MNAKCAAIQYVKYMMLIILNANALDSAMMNTSMWKFTAESLQEKT